MIYIKLCGIILSVCYFLNNGKASNPRIKSRSITGCGQNRFSDKLRKNQQARIIQGEISKLGQFPWMARLGIRHGKSEPMFFCGGSLVSRFFVLTAAHCEEDGDIIRLGENDASAELDCGDDGDCAEPHQDIEIRRYYFKRFCSVSLENDISLVELKKGAVLNDFVQPICIPRRELRGKDLWGQHIWLSGWGKINPRLNKYSDQLLYITAPLVNPATCNKIYKSDKLKFSQLCIGYSKGRDTCEGDSGGPAAIYLPVKGQLRAHVVGIVSYGLELCGSGPAVYTNVSHFLDWVEYTLKRRTA